MYTVYIPKYRGDIPDYNIIRVISRYMSSTDYECRIITAPGYMNKKETTTNAFYDEMEPIFLTSSLGISRNTEVGIFNGMNGTHIMTGSAISCREQHERSIVLHHLKLISLNCSNRADHRKIMFFMEKISPFDKILTLANYTDFLETVIVKGILIGSSNQNLTTYYGGQKKSSADKGEADVFMFVGNEVKNAILKDELLIENIIISESISVPNSSDECYLKSILEDFLKNSLK